MNYKTKQELLWASSFGENYIHRNNSEKLLHSKMGMFSRLLKSASNIKSIRELGCNIGLNLLAIRNLKPDLKLYGVEINKKAAKIAQDFKVAEITNDTALNVHSTPRVDLVMSVGFLIHINPSKLDQIYENLYNGSNKYILIAEYFNPDPVTIDYRGNPDALFKRDFADELMKKYDLGLVDYGFIYHRDNWIPQDNLNWFLLEKRNY